MLCFGCARRLFSSCEPGTLSPQEFSGTCLSFGASARPGQLIIPFVFSCYSWRGRWRRLPSYFVRAQRTLQWSRSRVSFRWEILLNNQLSLPRGLFWLVCDPLCFTIELSTAYWLVQVELQLQAHELLEQILRTVAQQASFLESSKDIPPNMRGKLASLVSANLQSNLSHALLSPPKQYWPSGLLCYWL